MSWLFASGGQSTGASVLESVFPKSTQCWFPLGLTGFIFLLSKRFSRIFSSTTVLQRSVFFMAQLSHPYMTTGKTIPLTVRTFDGKVMHLLFNKVMSLLFKSLLCLLWIPQLTAAVKKCGVFNFILLDRSHLQEINGILIQECNLVSYFYFS